MVSNGDRYKPLQVHPDDHEVFKGICEKLSIAQTQGFKLAVQTWKVQTDEVLNV